MPSNEYIARQCYIAEPPGSPEAHAAWELWQWILEGGWPYSQYAYSVPGTPGSIAKARAYQAFADRRRAAMQDHLLAVA